VVDIIWSVGSFFACLNFDDFTGESEEPQQVKRRAAQLR
jgi:hypothetical protein